MVASALHYSKYHLHRIFTKTVGLTIHDYTKRRQLTEAAKPLVFSAKPIIEIAFMSRDLESLTIDGYLCLDKADYTANLQRYIADKRTLILREGAASARAKWNAAADMPPSQGRERCHWAVGVMGFSPDTGSIDFLAVYPQYRLLALQNCSLISWRTSCFAGKRFR